MLVALVSIIEGTEIVFIPFSPVFEAKLITAIGPLPANGIELIIAILIIPGNEVLAVNMLLDTRLPFVTVGDANIAVS